MLGRAPEQVNVERMRSARERLRQNTVYESSDVFCRARYIDSPLVVRFRFGVSRRCANEVDHTRTCEGGSCGVSLADSEVCGPASGISFCAGGTGDERGATARRHSL